MGACAAKTIDAVDSGKRAPPPGRGPAWKVPIAVQPASGSLDGAGATRAGTPRPLEDPPIVLSQVGEGEAVAQTTVVRTEYWPRIDARGGSTLVRRGTIMLKAEPTPSSASSTTEVDDTATASTGSFSMMIPASKSDVQLEFKFGSKLGSGFDAQVFEGEYPDGRRVAIKAFKKINPRRTHAAERAHQEADLLQKLKHPNIVAYIDFINSKNYDLLVMEMANLGDFLVALQRLTAKGTQRVDSVTARRLSCQIVQGLRFAHSLGIAHGDIKLENLLVSTYDEPGAPMRLMIADWAFSRDLNSPKAFYADMGCVGSDHYSAPELLRGESTVCREADCWSVGVVLYAIMYSRLPFSKDGGLHRFLQRVCEDPIIAPEYDDPMALMVLKRLFDRNKHTRGSMEEISEMGWFSEDSWCQKRYHLAQ